MKKVLDKRKCCGCGACFAICPQRAIKIVEDEEGFYYPIIDETLCISCNLCKKVCNYSKEKVTETDSISKQVYVSVTKDKECLLRSASGGIFSAIANKILDEHGIVYGASFETKNNMLYLKHISVKEKKDLYKLQGSKYVQSDITHIYNEIKNELKESNKVLFSGTPCQIDALYGFLGNQKYNNLYTIEIICHGVPNIIFFNDYLKSLKIPRNCNIVDFVFRDKSRGEGYKPSVYYEKKGKVYKKNLHAELSSYLKFFSNQDILRENCYECKYAGYQRVADLTIGDFWGIENVHPDYLTENGGKIDKKNGVSCIIVNTKKGKTLINKINDDIILLNSSYNKVAKFNDQLSFPATKSKKRDIIFDLYKKQGYDAVQKYFYKNYIGIYKIIKTKIRLLLKMK